MKGSDQSGSATASQDNSAAHLPLYGTPLREMTWGYRARNPALLSALIFLDFLGKLHPKRPHRLPDRPLRILIANWAHLGDVVAMLPLLQYLADQARIESVGVLVGSWSKAIVAELPYVKAVHCLDHFLLDRSTASRTDKIRRYWKGQRQIVNELKGANYDVSIDLFAVFPPTHRLTWKAGIPTRIGFSCTGMGTYLTHPFGWVADDEYVLDKQLRLLEPIFGLETPKSLPPAYPNFEPSRLPDELLSPDRKYILMHVGVGDYRSWPERNWLELGRSLKDRGWEVVLTGAMGSEAITAHDIAQAIGARSVAGKLSWNQFVTVVSNATALVSVDTVTGHLAACFGIPSIILLSGRWGTKFFRPNHPRTVTLTYPVGCAPCYRSMGCAQMACVKYISVANVLSVFEQITKS